MKARRIYLLQVLALSAGACRLLQQRALYHQEQQATAAGLTLQSDSMAQHTGNQQQRLQLLANSSGNRYEVEIIPDGPFRFSPDSGFVGQAAWLRYRGAATRQETQMYRQGSIEQRDSSRSGLRVQAMQAIRRQQVNQTVQRYRLGLVIGLLLILLLAAGVLWRQMRR